MLHILLSTYNGERYLAAQMDSILSQTYSDWKLFVRDDGSTDGTLRLLNQYAKQDKRITLISDGENIGACKSFERLLTTCGDADYFAFADQDDVWDANKLSLCIEAIQHAEQETPDMPIVVHTDLRVVDEHLQEVASSFWRYSRIYPNLLDTHIRYLAICNSVTGCAMLFNRAARTCALPMGRNAYMHDAWIALMTCYHHGRVIAVPQTTVAYRQHSGNVLGAVRYSVFQRSLARRREEAQIAFLRAKGYVYRSYAQFLIWKVIYFIHRSFYTLTA